MLEQTKQHSVTYHLGHDPSEVGYAREQARKTVPGWGLAEHCYLIEVLLSELVTNAVHHGEGEIEVCLSYACGRLRIEVHDDGRERPVLRQPAPEDSSGRGLALVNGLMDLYGGVWGVADDSAGPGKAVFAAIRVPPAPKPAR
ncbi:MAG TPA: ATP-binding protein [Streptosporangiaceae bacterium]